MSSASSQIEMEVDEIVERMRSVRKSGQDHVVTLRGDAKRLVDWKEYVGAKPILSVAVVSLIGFVCARKVGHVFSRTPRPILAPRAFSGDSKSITSTIGSSIVTLASSIATNAVKTYVASLMQRGISKGDFND